MAKAKTDQKVTYLLEMRNGDKKKISIPAHWKLTFGPLCPGSKDGGLNSTGATALRLYDGTNQKAVFTGVESFRDLSIGIEVEVTKSKQETFYKDDPEGGERKAVVMEASVKEWINPDAPRAGSEFDSRPAMPRLIEACESALPQTDKRYR